MKTRETKQKDLVALTESLQNAKSAMVVSFSKLTVNKDIEFRNHLREAGARYQVVKNTLARIAAKDTQFEQATEHFKGVTAIAWTENDPVILAKSISKFMKDNAEIYTFKTGVVDGRLVDLKQVQDIASLPSKEELISKMLWVLNAQAQRIVTVINAVPRDLAIVIKQIGDKIPESGGAATAEAPAAEAPAAEAPAVEAVTDGAPVATEEAAPAATEEAPAEVTEAAAPGAEAPAESAPAEEVSSAPAEE
ncbi:MAG: 50S ribosomal protein L10, partial [Blastocatellia bacterium]|nr:50S ribosomal protein L10 [Blastocatellia bacterium]